MSAGQIIRDPVMFLAFGFGSGLSRYMPGTMGTIVAIPIYWGLMQTGVVIYSIITIASLFAGIYLCDSAAKKLKVHDFGGIVWDEIGGYLVTMWIFPFTWANMLAGFILFRLFDIVKPWPIKWIDRQIHGGLGIMLDDILAAVFAALSLTVLYNVG